MGVIKCNGIMIALLGYYIINLDCALLITIIYVSQLNITCFWKLVKPSIAREPLMSHDSTVQNSRPLNYFRDPLANTTVSICAPFKDLRRSTPEIADLVKHLYQS